MSHRYIMALAPALHTRVWGGRGLETVFGKSLPTDAPYGEAWECHDSARVLNGDYAGATLGEVLAQVGSPLIGEQFDPADGLPLLVKLLDSHAWLSVQVHPDDALARELAGEPRGKNEAWVVLHAEPGAQLISGVRAGVTRPQFEAALRGGDGEALLALLVRHDVHTDDVINVAAGTIHALGPGIIIYEIQQSSDLTYRLYDWGRVGLDGVPRQLHIDESVRCARLDLAPEPEPSAREWRNLHQLVATPYFELLRVGVRPTSTSIMLGDDGRFSIITCTTGTLRVYWEGDAIILGRGATAFAPSGVAYALSGEGEALVALPV